MNLQEFQRWAEGQRVTAAVGTLVSAKTLPSEKIDDYVESGAQVSTSNDGSPGSARRFLGTLRWGK